MEETEDPKTSKKKKTEVVEETENPKISKKKPKKKDTEEGAESTPDPATSDDQAVGDLIKEIEVELATEPVSRRVRSKSRPRDDEAAGSRKEKLGKGKGAELKEAPASPRAGPKKRKDPAQATVSEAAPLALALEDHGTCVERRW